MAQEVFDVAGAGDTVIAAFALALAAQMSMPDAAMLANYAAGIVVGKVGTAVATPAEILARVIPPPARGLRSRPSARPAVAPNRPTAGRAGGGINAAPRRPAAVRRVPRAAVRS